MLQSAHNLGAIVSLERRFTLNSLEAIVSGGECARRRKIDGGTSCGELESKR